MSTAKVEWWASVFALLYRQAQHRLPIRWHHGSHTSHLIESAWVWVGIGRWINCRELCLLGRLRIGTESLELDQACITAAGGTKGDGASSPAKPVSAERHITGTTVLTVDLGNSGHRLIMLVHLCDGHVTSEKRAGTEWIHRKCMLNGRMEGPAKGCYCLHSWLERSETGSSNLAQNPWHPLSARGSVLFWLFQLASMPSSLAWANRDYKTGWFLWGQIFVSDDSLLWTWPQDNIVCSSLINMSLAIISLPLCGQLQRLCDLLVTCHGYTGCPAFLVFLRWRDFLGHTLNNSTGKALHKWGLDVHSLGRQPSIWNISGPWGMTLLLGDG